MKKTLNFLFVVLFIIVFAYLFIPDKQYTNKLWAVKGISLAQPYKAAVIEYVMKTRSLPGPGDLEHAKIQVKVNFNNTPVKNITIGERGPGTVTVYFFDSGIESAPAEINNRTITLVPSLIENKLSWSCASTLPVEFVPRACK